MMGISDMDMPESRTSKNQVKEFLYLPKRSSDSSVGSSSNKDFFPEVGELTQ